MTNSFSVLYRNPGHWDICANNRREWRIRGCHGDIVVFDERPGLERKVQDMGFHTVSTALMWIADHYMTDSNDGAGK